MHFGRLIIQDHCVLYKNHGSQNPPWSSRYSTARVCRGTRIHVLWQISLLLLLTLSTNKYIISCEISGFRVFGSGSILRLPTESKTLSLTYLSFHYREDLFRRHYTLWFYSSVGECSTVKCELHSDKTWVRNYPHSSRSLSSMTVCSQEVFDWLLRFIMAKRQRRVVELQEALTRVISHHVEKCRFL